MSSSNTVTITTSSASAQSSEWVYVWHGTDEVSAHYLASEGLSVERLREFTGAWAFWTSTDRQIACGYAYMNQFVFTKQRLPFVVGFGLPSSVLLELSATGSPPLVDEDVMDKAYRFLPETFTTVNAVRTNFSMEQVTKWDLKFSE